MVDIADEYIWMVVAGFIAAFVLALGIGANDVANTFGTSVGAKVLTVRQACIIAAIFETLGAILLGGKVAETVRKGIIDVEPYENSTQLFLAGNVAALSGSTVWLIIATALRMPVSTSHSIVGATVGFALVAHGSKGVDWFQLGMIVLSWFISPVLSGFIALAIFWVCEYFILKNSDPIEPGLRWLHIFYSLTIAINFFSIFYGGPEMLYFHRIPLWGCFIISCGSGILTALCVRIWLVPWQRRKIKAEKAEMENLERKMEDEIGNEGHEGYVSARETLDSLGTPYAISDGKIVAADLKPPQLTQADGTKQMANGFVNYALEHDKNSKGATNYPNGDIKHIDGATNDNLTSSLEKKNMEGANNIRHRTVSLKSDEFSTKDEEDTKSQISQKTLSIEDRTVEDKFEHAKLFSFLMILTATFGAFVHGGNDVSNAIGPFVSIWLTATTGSIDSDEITPLWILLYGGIGISIGLFIWGRRVIETVGEDISKVVPSSGFPIELGAATTVLLASNLGLPISTTHCKVGAIVFVGYYRMRDVNWKLFIGIFFAWVVTLPVAGGVSAAFMAIFMTFVPHTDF